MKLQESGEMYLETIYILSKKLKFVRSIDVAREMNFSKPSVSRAMNLLKFGGFITIGDDGKIQLTGSGLAIAAKTYERHELLTGILTELGVSPSTAEEDACRVEHVISDETFEILKRKYENRPNENTGE